LFPLHSKKKVREFPVPSRNVTTKLSLGGNNDVITELFLPRGSFVSDIPAGDGKLVNLFLRCRLWSLMGRYVKYGCSTSQPGWELIPGLLIRFTNTGSGNKGGRGRGLPPHPLQYQWPLEGVGPETHVHKITNVPVFYIALGLHDFDAGKSITQAIGRGCALVTPASKSLRPAQHHINNKHRYNLSIFQQTVLLVVR
jgi:hypothetical protein